MTTFAVSDLESADRYKLLTGLVVPRPIGWIGTTDGAGHHNLAPYSFFQCVATNPPMLLFSGGTRNGEEKDSVANARMTGDFTYNVVGREVVEAMNETSAELPAGDSEFDFAGLTPRASTAISAPGVAEAKAVFECRVDRIIELGEAPAINHVVFGEVLLIHVDDDLLDGTRVDFDTLDAVGRLAGNAYATTRDRFEIRRPG